MFVLTLEGPSIATVRTPVPELVVTTVKVHCEPGIGEEKHIKRYFVLVRVDW